MMMSQLYDEMKATLKFFDLSFSQMDQIAVTFQEDTITFHNGGRSVTIDAKIET